MAIERSVSNDGDRRAVSRSPRNLVPTPILSARGHDTSRARCPDIQRRYHSHDLRNQREPTSILIGRLSHPQIRLLCSRQVAIASEDLRIVKSVTYIPNESSTFAEPLLGRVRESVRKKLEGLLRGLDF